MLIGQEIVNNYYQAYYKNYYAWNPLFPYADRDLRMYLGDQWNEEEKRAIYQEGRSTYVNNFIRPNINMITGYQKKHRHSSVCVPIEADDQRASDQLTKILLYVFQHGDMYEMISDCFKGGIVTGWNLFSLWKDYRTDPLDGSIKCSREPYNGFLCDPYFTKKDMSDCSNIQRRKYLPLPLVKSLLPGMETDLDMLYHIGWERDDKFTWLPYQQLPNGGKMMAYDEFWEQGWEPKKYIYNSMTGETMDYMGEESDYFLFSDPNMELIERTEPFVYQHIIVNSEYIKSEKNPYGLNEYPFVPFFGIFEPESSDYVLKVQSLIRTMIDPQRITNQMSLQMLDLVQSQINSGWIAPEDSVVNPRSLFQTSQGKTIWTKKGIQPGEVQKIQPAQIPPSFFDLKAMFQQHIMQVAGISEELLGQADSEQDSGLKVLLRQGASLVGLQDIFDNLRFAQEQISKKVLKMTQSWSKQKFKRILNEEPDEKIFKLESMKYDIAVQEGVLTNTQQQLFFNQLLGLKEIGEPVPPGLLAKVAPLQGKTEYMQAMEQFNQQQQQAQQQVQQIEMEKNRVQSELFQTQSIANIGTAKERFTRAVANLGLEDERASKSVDNRSDSVLKRMQAIKQLEAMDDDKIVKLLNVFLALEDVNRNQEERMKAKDVEVSATAEKQQQKPEVNNAR